MHRGPDGAAAVTSSCTTGTLPADPIRVDDPGAAGRVTRRSRSAGNHAASTTRDLVFRVLLPHATCATKVGFWEVLHGRAGTRSTRASRPRALSEVRGDPPWG